MNETTSAPEAHAGAAPGSVDDGYYVAATSGAAQAPRRVLKHADLFGLFDAWGDIGGGGASGLYTADTRVLSRLELLLDGERPLLLSSTVREDNAALAVDLTNPDRYADGALVLARDTLHIARMLFLWDGACHQRLALRNFGQCPVTVWVTLRFDADFVDLFEVRGHRRRVARGEITRAQDARSVTISYRARDGLLQRTRLEFDQRPDRLEPDRASWRLALAPGAREALCARVVTQPPQERSARRRRFFPALRAQRRALRGSAARAAAISSSNEIFDETVRRSIADLYMLITDTPQGPYPYAGVPWYSTPFGRDGLITALEMLWIDPEVARGVLCYLAANQATDYDPEADAEPGKILHETRQGELARSGEVPFRRYYGSVDATPLFVLLAGRYFEHTGDVETLKALWPHIEAALGWIDGDGDSDGDGFVDYRARRPGGLVNQGWKDSADAVFHADGTLAAGPIALVEVQGYVYAAKRSIAAVARALGQEATAARLQIEAEALRERFEEAFWSRELGSYVLALDGAGRPCAVPSSNAGHALFAGIAAPARARQVAATLLSPRSFCGWGIRTVAEGAARYNPMSYHNGSVWPHDNALIALGLAAYGHTEAVERVFEGVYRLAASVELRRLPELICGFRRKPGQGPTAYPVACAPQAWAAAAPLALLQASLGLTVDGIGGRVSLRHPRLPAFLEEVRIRRLKVGSGSVDLLLRRHDGDVAVNVIEREGDVAVEVQC